MRRALLDQHLWIGGTDAAGGILICLHSGRIIGTLQRNGAGWLGRAFVSPARLIEAWWQGLLPEFSVEARRSGLAIVSKGRDRTCVEQNVELMASVDLKSISDF